MFYWWQSVWNRIDMVVYLLYIVAIVLIVSSICNDPEGKCELLADTNEINCVDNTTCSTAAAERVHGGRMIFSVVTVFLFLRLTMFITRDLTLGPIVLMLIEV